MAMSYQDLQERFTAISVSFSWLGIQKSVSESQKDEMAQVFGASGDNLNVAKRLFNTKNPAYRDVSTLRSQVNAYWKSLSLPYPQPGIRLIANKDVESFDAKMKEFNISLKEAVSKLDAVYEDIKSEAKSNLKHLYDDADYPETLKGMFNFEWTFSSIIPPAHLLQLNPDLYKQEEDKIKDKFQSALLLAEQGFASEMEKLISNLNEKLTEKRLEFYDNGCKKLSLVSNDIVKYKPEENSNVMECQASQLTVGDYVLNNDKWFRIDTVAEPKQMIFKQNSLDNIKSLIQKIREFNIGSNGDLDKLYDGIDNLTKNITADDLRKENSALKTVFQKQLSEYKDQIENLMVAVPSIRRRIIMEKESE